MIRLNVFIQVSESNRAAVLEAAKELVASSLKDKGCVAEKNGISHRAKAAKKLVSQWRKMK